MGIVTGLTGQITSTISEQNNSNGQFLEGMRQIRNGSMQIANSSIQITEMSQQLKELSRDLNQNLLRNY
jgi:methyl-accepting chemotaxis protein